jgi:hypothetical protein
MATKNNELEMFSFDQIKDEFIGEIGTEKRTHYEQDLQLELLGKMIRKVRLERNLTQEELGKLNTMAPLTGFTLTGNPEVKRLDILACHLAKETFLHQTHRW